MGTPKPAAAVPDETAEMIEVPRALVEQTLKLILAAPAAQVYVLLQAWDDAIPGLLSRT